jgi:hypothetical protein
MPFGIGWHWWLAHQCVFAWMRTLHWRASRQCHPLPIFFPQNARPGLREASPAAFAHGFASDDLRRPTWSRPRVPVQALVQPPARVPPPARGPVLQQAQSAEAPARSYSHRRPPWPPANSHTDRPATTCAFSSSYSPPGLQSCLRPPPRLAKTATAEGPTRARPNRTCKKLLYHNPAVSTDFFAAASRRLPPRVWPDFLARSAKPLQPS